MKDYSYYPRVLTKFNKLSRLFIVQLVLGLLTTGFILFWPWIRARIVSASPPDPKVTITTSTDHPDERKISVTPDGYKVAADQPRVLSFPSLNESAYLQRVGVDQKGRVAVPNNVSLAGWYVKSVKPGDSGLSIIDGHVSGIYKPGVFGRLSKLHAGDTFVVEYGDKSQKHFSVTKTQTVTEANANTALFVRQPDIKAQLNLITCTTYVAHTKTYVDRLIITAKLVSD